MSNWGWYSFPNTQNYSHSQVLKPYLAQGKIVEYIHRFSAKRDNLKSKTSEWLRENPHKLHLEIIDLVIKKSDGSKVTLEDIQNPQKNLDTRKGLTESNFEIEGITV